MEENEGHPVGPKAFVNARSPVLFALVDGSSFSSLNPATDK